MNLPFKIIAFFLITWTAFAEPPTGAGKCDSTLLKDTRLSCISCALQKLNRPPIDENYLVSLGLVVRENRLLLPNDKLPSATNSTRSSFDMDASHDFPTPNGPIRYTAEALYQKHVMELLLATGYCGPGKLKPDLPNNNYKDSYARIKSDQYFFPQKKETIPDKRREELNTMKSQMNNAAREVGFSNWEKMESTIYFPEDKNFFKLNYSAQKKLADERRASLLQDASSQIPDCLREIEQEYVPKQSKAEQAYAVCEAVYESCKIGTTTNGNIYRTYNGARARVGGNPCKDKYLEGGQVPATASSATSAHANEEDSGITLNGKKVPLNRILPGEGGSIIIQGEPKQPVVKPGGPPK